MKSPFNRYYVFSFFKILCKYGIIDSFKIFYSKIFCDNARPLVLFGLNPKLFLRLRSSDESVYDELFNKGQYYLDLPRKVNVIIDAGANIGCSALYFAKEHPSATIICIEADLANFEILQKNCRGYDKITCLHAALWKHEGNVQLNDPNLGAWAYRVSESSDYHETNRSIGNIPAVTIESIMNQFNLSTVDILKVDIEGSEKEIFKDPPRALDRVNVFIIETHDRWIPGCSRVIIEATKNFDYEWTQGECLAFCRDGWLPGSFTPDDYSKIE